MFVLFTLLQTVTKCAAGMRLHRGKPAIDAKCERCSPGTFNPKEDGSMVCIAHQACKAGEWTEAEGDAKTDTNCSACGAGRFRATASSAKTTEIQDKVCILHQACKAGEWIKAEGDARTDTKCSKCPPGMYQSSHSAHECKAPSAGHYARNATHEQPCEEGTFKSGPGPASECIKCQPGRYSDVKAAEQCRVSVQRACVKTCQTPPAKCDEWHNAVYKRGGCAWQCPLKIKLDYRPNPLCKHTVTRGDSVILKSGLMACVALVLDPYAIVRLGGGTKSKLEIRDLVLVRQDDPECQTQKDTAKEPAPANGLVAVINGPSRVTAGDCTVVTLDAYQSTSPGSGKLVYAWTVPVALANLVGLGRSSPALSFSNAPAGDYTFGLKVTNADGKTVIAPDFHMTVSPKPAPALSMRCAPGVCTREGASAYALQVSLHEETTITLNVELASDCNGKSQGTLQPIKWEERKIKTGVDGAWQPLQVRGDMW